MTRPRAVVFASGRKRGGGSGFKKLVEASREDILEADIVAVVSQHQNGGVHERAVLLNIPFILFPRGSHQLPDPYNQIARACHADFCFLSGWTLYVYGIDPRKWINIHPARLPIHGGQGWHGIAVHERVLAAFRSGDVRTTAVSMHFVTPKYDDGEAVFFEQEVEIKEDDDPHTLAARVNEVEHRFQARVSDLVVRGEVGWDGADPRSIRTPAGYIRKRPVTFVDDERLVFPSVVRKGVLFYVTHR
ncbi:hypothetical protein HY416_00115 [Candidatus Kaiserbacteria bacterium]|nr:hypothetical protein [Candidatus Kaiserbacteria bacterium]